MTSNYERYFGTPERAAETIDDLTACCGSDGDSMCKLCRLNGKCEYELHILKWLKEEAE